MPGGRLRAERLLRLIETGRVDPGLLLTHKFYGFSHVEQALYLMKDKTSDLIKPVVILPRKNPRRSFEPLRGFYGCFKNHAVRRRLRRLPHRP